MIRRELLLVLLWLAPLALPTPVASQARRDHRIEVTSGPSRKPVPPAGRARSRPPGVAGATVDWLGHEQAPATLRLPSARSVTLLADDIAFSGTTYRLAGASRLILVGSTIRVSGKAHFDLSARRSGDDGGSLAIVARKLVCAPGARWTIESKGGDAQAGRAGFGGRGGNLTVAVDEIVSDTAPPGTAIRRPGLVFGPLRPGAGMAPSNGPIGNRAPSSKTATVACISFTSTGGKGGAGSGAGTADRRARHGTRGRLVRYDDRARAGAADEELSRSLSLWALEVLQRLRSQVLQAQGGEDHGALIKLFQRYASFTSPDDVHPALRRDLDNVRAELNRLRSDLLLPVYPRPVEVQIAGVPHRLHVLTESSPFRSTLAPTHTLSVGTTIAGRQVLGVMEFDPGRPDELAIEFEIELTLDPWLAALALGKLRASGDSVAGMFTGWRLAPRAHDELGVKESRITALPDARRMRVRLVVEGDKAGAVFWKLLSGGGIPLTYDWEYRGQPGQPLTQGTWVGPSLSLARRASHAVRFERGHLRNAGELAVSLEYVGLGSGDYAGLARALELDPGDSVSVDSIGLPAGARRDSLCVPPEAVVTVLDPLEVERSFHVLNGQGFINHLTVSNLLPAMDESLGGALEYVEVFVSIARDSEPGATDLRAGPYRLSAAHTNGSEISLPFLRQGSRQRVTVWGAAHYENGSCQTLASTTVEAWSVKITPAMLIRRSEAVGAGGQGDCSDATVADVSHSQEETTP